MFAATPENIKAEKKLLAAKYIAGSSLVDILFTCGGFTLLSIVLFPVTDRKTLLIWMLINGGALLVRYITFLSFRNSKKHALRERAGTYLFLFFSTIILTSLFFGSAGLFILPLENIFHPLLITIILWGTSILSVDSTVPSYWIAVAHPLCMVLPVTTASLLSAKNDHIFIGALGVVFLGVHLLFSMKLNRFFANNLCLQLDNTDLTAGLIQEVKHRIEVENKYADITNTSIREKCYEQKQAR
ncbi:MAG: hypothetical protein M8357_04920 [Desulfobulbaceae bacterium]|nr:hypothetical protein [Desulfobulbaceae bacterium]